jgi:hypothetical protein
VWWLAAAVAQVGWMMVILFWVHVDQSPVDLHFF